MSAAAKPAPLLAGGKAFPVPRGMSLSHWLQGVRANPLLDKRTTETLPASADVVIIGSGLTGTLTAYELLTRPDPPKNVVVLEARELCSGATGRNAGHCKPDQYRGFAKYSKLFGKEQAKKLLAHEWETWEKLVAFVQREKVDCDLWVGDTLDVAMTDEAAAKNLAVYEDYKAYGGKVDHITYTSVAVEAEKVSRLKGAKAVWAWKASTLYPWKLVAHLMRICLAKGLNLQTWTPATSVTSSDGGHWAVNTARGSITTPTVVYATNAYTSGLIPSWASYIQPTAHMCNKVVPPRAFAGARALRNSYAVLADDGTFTINQRCTSDGTLLFGGDNPNQHWLKAYLAQDESGMRLFDDSLSDFEPVTQAVRDLATQSLEGWDEDIDSPGVGPVYAWSGIIGQSADGLPFIGPLPDHPGQWVAAGFHGHGMPHIFTCAPGLVTLMQGGTWADTGLPECLELTKERLAKIGETPDFNKPIV
ncbi:FAD-dependent oxidoreductase [Mycena chlorophos]|uniref:FAD-dependent oxidoreductase n=1 Tax=Mycena chlorophos TaxID=658473 RepID=A0A8H6TIC7_MYCCL|nr:FAD-dependent oxidoreductase [Mycena chlorophos]